MIMSKTKRKKCTRTCLVGKSSPAKYGALAYLADPVHLNVWQATRQEVQELNMMLSTEVAKSHLVARKATLRSVSLRDETLARERLLLASWQRVMADGQRHLPLAQGVEAAVERRAVESEAQACE